MSENEMLRKTYYQSQEDADTIQGVVDDQKKRGFEISASQALHFIVSQYRAIVASAIHEPAGAYKTGRKA